MHAAGFGTLRWLVRRIAQTLCPPHSGKPGDPHTHHTAQILGLSLAMDSLQLSRVPRAGLLPPDFRWWDDFPS